MKKFCEKIKSSAQIVILLLFLFDFANSHTSSPADEKDDIFGNLTSPFLNFLDDFFYYLERNVSTKCQNDTNHVIELARRGDVDALKLLDASGKPSGGVLEGNVYFIGRYSECVSSAEGKHCLVELNVTTVFPHIPFARGSLPPTLGLCVPRSCTDEDVQSAAAHGASENFVGSEARVAACHDGKSGIRDDAGAVITVAVFVFFGLLAISATVFDFIAERRKSYAIEKTMASTVELFDREKDGGDPPSSLGARCLLSFSLRQNAGKIFAARGEGGIRCIHGLKFLSMALIILGHTFSFATQNLYIMNPGMASQAPKDFLTQVFANGTIAVDTFYLISGLLVCFVTLKTMDKLNGKLPLFYFYLHRFFRLTPLLGAVVLFCACVLGHIGSGPRWRPSILMYDTWCRSNGWLNVLYLQNFLNTENMCLSHSWYLATDMQMYLVSPLILVPLHRGLKWGAISMGTFLLATFVTTAALTAANHYPAIPYINNVVPIEIVNAYYKNVYIKPYCRIGPYIVGIAVGWYLLKHKELGLRKGAIWFAWGVSIAVELCVIYLMWPANQGHLPTNAEASAYGAIARTAWACAVGWLVVACCMGHGGVVDRVLSWPPLVPLSRLTYCAYLIHPVVMNAHYGLQQAPVYFSMNNVLYLFLGNVCVTYLLSLLLSLLFEAPFIGLEKALLSRKT